MVDTLLDFLFGIFKVAGNLYYWLTSPFITRQNIGLGWLVLERLGVDITWIYNTTPLTWITGGVVTFLSTILLIKFVGMILDAIPIFGG